MPPFLTGRRRAMFALLLALSFAHVCIGVVTAQVVAGLIAGFERSAGELDRAAFAMLLASIAAIALIELGRRRTTEELGLDYARRVRTVLFERLLRRPLLGGSQRSRGSILLPFVGDLTALRQWWADGVARGLSSALIAAGLCLTMALQSWRLGVAMALLVTLSLAAMAICARPYARATRRQRRERGAMTALISDRIAAAHTVFAFGGMQRELRRVDRRALAMNRAALRRAVWSGAMRAVAAAAHPAGVTLTLLVAALSPGPGGMALHQVVGSLTLVGLLGACVGDMARAAELAIPARIARARLEARLAEVTPLRLARAGAGRAAPRDAELLCLRALRLHAAHQPFSTEVAAGDIVLVDGPPGSGKSALLAMIAGFQQAEGGVILIAGHAATRLPQAQRRIGLGYAGAAAPLLQASVSENLNYRLRGVEDPQAMAELLRDAGLAHWLDAGGSIAPRGLRDQGRGLSGAELQAAHLVRAMVGKPPLLVIDDMFGALPTQALSALLARICAWPGGVVLASGSAEVRNAANRRWIIAENGLCETAAIRAVPGAEIVSLPAVRA